MYLKSIEVQGFKSFANKILFEFHNGITGIVGPNGSGKSNVADAVRWVLGEQRIKQLRGGTMQDVIFSGTENRKPLSYASVAITLDNSDHQLPIDYKEVTVARKLYRSGESEYLINGSACRLKDVNELFYDTGIGKEGYSIIGQGQIDKILSGKPEERRELFDEAAGIVKFKRRKNMSVKKLEDERQNLLRVNDILAELEKQIGPLGRQAETAKEYLKKKEELKRFDINMFLLDTERINAQLKELEEKLSYANEEIQSASEQYETTKEEYEKIEEKIDSIDASLERYKSQLSETNLLKQQLLNQIALLKEQINSVKMNDEHFVQRQEAIKGEMQERLSNQAALKQEKELIEKELKSYEIKEAQAQKELLAVQSEIAKLSVSVENGKSQIMDMLNSRASTKVKNQHFDTMLEQIRVQRAEIHKRLIELKAETEEQYNLSNEYKEELTLISERIRKIVEENKQYEELIDEVQETLKKQTEAFSIGQTAYHRESSRLESLKNITERYDGYGNSIRRVMEQKEKVAGLVGVVADIIKVEKEYEIAVETALGGSIQNIVTSDEETAKEMITFLKRNKFGRATFLPLTSLKGGSNFKNPEVLKENGVIGLAHTLVKVEEKYRALAENLLGRTVVVKNIDHGIMLARKYRQSLRIVTLEGELINAGGAMTGGAFKNASNLLSRRREIEEFEKTVLQLKKEMNEMEAVLNEGKKKRAEYYAKTDAIQQKLQKEYVLQNTAKMNFEQAKAHTQELKQSVEELMKEGRELESQIQDIEENKESIQMELETSEKMELEVTGSIEEQQKQLEKMREKETTALRKSEELHVSYANMKQKQEFLLENEERIQEELLKYTEELKGLEANKGNALEEIQEKEGKIEEIQQTIENSKELFAEIEKEIKVASEKKEELSVKNKAFIRRREELSKHMAELDKEIFRLTSKKENSEQTLEKQIDYMWEEYEITYNHALSLRDETLTDLNFMKKEIHSIKNAIKALGNVNVNAIEDYKNVSERYEFLKKQQSDLVEAEGTLMKIIAELDEAMRKQFAEQFERIRVEYDKVFKQLFGGGKGTLELMEDEDILDAGIRIIAQPPGKKLQNMMQLSGGEKALTAISLLFAIQNLKPSPFCLLDEIEAALDDSNVVRFAEYLHKLTENTQFIVITHRRGTMTAADRLYGITMQEKGISTLVSVDLLENDLTK